MRRSAAETEALFQKQILIVAEQPPVQAEVAGIRIEFAAGEFEPFDFGRLHAVDQDCPPPATASASASWRGHARRTALTSVANGIAKNTPQNPQMPPKTRTAMMIAMGWRLTTSENSTGTSTLPSSNWMIA